MLKLSRFRYNHHPSGVKMLENLFDVDFQSIPLKSLVIH